MLGFSDLQDLDFLSSREVARRMGFGSWASLRRALAARGEDLPPSLFRGRHRGDSLKAWFAQLPAAGIAPKLGAGAKPDTPPEGARENTPRPDLSPSRPAAEIVGLEARRRTALQRLRSV